MDKYVIYKSSRMPDAICGSYTGPTWDRAGLRDRYKAFYDSYEVADSLAKELTRFNPGVGFCVALV